MKLCHSLVCFIFFQALQDGNADLATAEIPIHAEREGGNITVGCSFSLSGGLRLFCKEKCEQGKIFIETTEDTAQRGRYSIEYKEGSFLGTKTVMYVSITKLEVSDSGVYRCSLGRVGAGFFDSNYEFQISVKEASTPTMKMTPESSNSTVTSSSTEAFQHFATQPASSDLLLYMGLVVIVLIAFLSAALLIFCRRRATKPKRPPVENVYSSIIDDNQLYEEIGEETFPPPVEMSSVYATATFPQPDGVESSDD